MVSPDPEVVVREQHDDTRLAALLETDRAWAAYALCDLEPPYRAYATYLGAERQGRLTALVLAYAPPGFASLVPYGEPADVAAILVRSPALPQRATLLSQWRHRPAVETRYTLHDRQSMLRMIVPAAAVPPPVPVEADIVPLDLDDLPRLEGLYAQWPEAMFARSMFAPGLYFGAWRRGELVAAAGAHAFSARHGMGVVGAVFTDPAHRGAGLGTAVTGATVRALLAAGAREVALNVRSENRPAIATYLHLGFTMREDFFEAAVTLR